MSCWNVQCCLIGYKLVFLVNTKMPMGRPMGAFVELRLGEHHTLVHEQGTVWGVHPYTGHRAKVREFKPVCDVLLVKLLYIYMKSVPVRTRAE